MQKDETPDSAAMELLQVLWSHRQEKTGHSWLRLNQSMREGLMLAVKMGLSFNLDDLSRMSDRFRAGYWFGENLENFYRDAVLYRNTSAYRCFETFHARDPFIWPDAVVEQHHAAGIDLPGGGRTGGSIARLVVGARITWKGEPVTITSFNDSATVPYMNACSYERTERKPCPRCAHCHSCGTRGEEKILHRFKITQAELKEQKKILKLQCEVTLPSGEVAKHPMVKVQQQLFRESLEWAPSFQKMQTSEGLTAKMGVIRVLESEKKVKPPVEADA